ncbi:MAG: hypothetical protein ACI4VB_07310 [Bradymonadia bacterium]
MHDHSLKPSHIKRDVKSKQKCAKKCKRETGQIEPISRRSISNPSHETSIIDRNAMLKNGITVRIIL